MCFEVSIHFNTNTVTIHASELHKPTNTTSMLAEQEHDDYMHMSNFAQFMLNNSEVLLQKLTSLDK